MGAITETVEGMISYTQEDWQKGHHAKVINYLKTCDIKSYVDLGANLGEVCNILKFFLPELTDAYLFEPQLDNYAFLQERYKDDPNIKCFNTADSRYSIGISCKSSSVSYRLCSKIID